MAWFYLLLAGMCGVMVPLQAGINGELARRIGQPATAALISVAVTLMVFVSYRLFLRAPLPGMKDFAALPWWLWTGGLLGAFFVIGSLTAAPKIGAASLVAFVVAGQILAALALDHFGIAGYATQAFSPWRLVGAAMLMVGVILILNS